MDYPIYIQGKPCGTLFERDAGLYTVFEADCPRQSGLVRLWLHGGGQSALLGLLAPDGDRLRLSRRLSRREREALPPVIERVSDEPVLKPPEPRETPRATGWRSLGDGSLLSDDGRLALPAALPPDASLCHDLLRIGGRDYLVFRLPARYNKI